MISTKRDFIKGGFKLGAISFLAAMSKETSAADYVAVVQCSYCGTGFRVEWHGTDTGYGVYQCPKCNKGSRVHWDQKGVQKVEKA
jgi:DNA-directed RNA polymerase subunit RPC12/RpoP